jgi:hypothetical protein
MDAAATTSQELATREPAAVVLPALIERAGDWLAFASSNFHREHPQSEHTGLLASVMSSVRGNPGSVSAAHSLRETS